MSISENAGDQCNARRLCYSRKLRLSNISPHSVAKLAEIVAKYNPGEKIDTESIRRTGNLTLLFSSFNNVSLFEAALTTDKLFRYLKVTNEGTQESALAFKVDAKYQTIDQLQTIKKQLVAQLKTFGFLAFVETIFVGSSHYILCIFEDKDAIITAQNISYYLDGRPLRPDQIPRPIKLNHVILGKLLPDAIAWMPEVVDQLHPSLCPSNPISYSLNPQISNIKFAGSKIWALTAAETGSSADIWHRGHKIGSKKVRPFFLRRSLEIKIHHDKELSTGACPSTSDDANLSFLNPTTCWLQENSNYSEDEDDMYKDILISRYKRIWADTVNTGCGLKSLSFCDFSENTTVRGLWNASTAAAVKHEPAGNFATEVVTEDRMTRRYSCPIQPPGLHVELKKSGDYRLDSHQTRNSRDFVFTSSNNLSDVSSKTSSLKSASCAQSLDTNASRGFNEKKKETEASTALKSIENIPQQGKKSKVRSNFIDLDKIRSGEEKRVTVMLRNIPNKIGQKELKLFLDETSANTYNFLYLRIDFTNWCNVGYAFISFTKAEHVATFVLARRGTKWPNNNSEKVIDVTYANVQGRDMLIRRFSTSPIMTMAPEFRPLLFYTEGPLAGQEEPFPRNLYQQKDVMV